MRKLLLLISMITVMSCSKDIVSIDPYADCRPQEVTLENSKVDPETGLIEFDIIPDKNYGTKGAALTSEDRLWKKNEEGQVVIPYYIMPSVTHPSGGTSLGFDRESDRNTIRAAIKEFEAETGFIIKEYANKQAAIDAGHRDGVFITPGFASSSAYKGRQGGFQRMTLSFGLLTRTIKHEWMHTVGVGHEFQRADRDEYVQVLYENIPEHYHRQFEIDPLTVDCGEFDINSIMMYSSYQIHTSEGKPIMLTVDGKEIEIQDNMTETDIGTLRAMYDLD